MQSAGRVQSEPLHSRDDHENIGRRWQPAVQTAGVFGCSHGARVPARPHGRCVDGRAVREALHSTPPERVHAGKFYAKRTFVRDRSLGERILAALPEELGFRGCVSDMRFYDYPLGGFIAPHLDEAHCCKETGRISTTTFLLYLLGVPEGEGGETVFLDRLPKDCLEGEDPRVLQSFVPVEGSILLFPHRPIT